MGDEEPPLRLQPRMQIKWKVMTAPFSDPAFPILMLISFFNRNLLIVKSTWLDGEDERLF